MIYRKNHYLPENNAKKQGKTLGEPKNLKNVQTKYLVVALKLNKYDQENFP